MSPTSPGGQDPAPVILRSVARKNLAAPKTEPARFFAALRMTVPILILLAACGGSVQPVSTAKPSPASAKPAASASGSAGLDALYQAAKADGAVTWQGNIFAAG